MKDKGEICSICGKDRLYWIDAKHFQGKTYCSSCVPTNQKTKSGVWWNLPSWAKWWFVSCICLDLYLINKEGFQEPYTLLSILLIPVFVGIVANILVKKSIFK